MADNRCPTVNERYLQTVADGLEQKGKAVEGDRIARQEDVEKVVRGVLPVLAGKTSQRPTSASRGEGKAISELEGLTTEASQSAPLPTPPTSPSDFGDSTHTPSAASLAAKTTEPQKIAALEASLEAHQSHIRTLTLELDNTQQDVQRLRNERREAHKEHLRAVCEDKEDEIEKFKRREERLIKMVEGKEQIIERVEKNLEVGRERERNLKRELAEAEKKIEETEQRLKEAERTVTGGKDAGVQSRRTVEDRAGARTRKPRLEIRRSRGEQERTYQLLYRRRPVF